MEFQANAFSALELDAENDDPMRFTSSSSDGTRKSSGNSKKKVNDSDNKLLVNEKQSKKNTEIPIHFDDASFEAGNSKKKVNDSDNKLLVNEKQSKKNTEIPPEECKMPLVWIDLEMTGLNVEVDRILEIACIITDGRLTKSVEGPDLVIHQNKECLDRMGEWCQTHHAASGLATKVLESSFSEREAEQQVIEFVKRNVGTYQPLLAGNSVYVDFVFLKKYMPDLASLFSHVLVDVSSIKALCIRWYPKDNKKAPCKENKHRALDDIRESIKELKYYKENIFKGFRK